MNRYQKNRKFIFRAALALFAFVAVILAIPTFGVSLLAFAAPKVLFAGGALAHGVASKFLLFGLAPFKYIEQVTKINGVGPGQISTIEFPLNKRLNVIWVSISIARAGYAQPPTVTDALTSYQFKVGGKPQRTRSAQSIFGSWVTTTFTPGLNAQLDANLAGMVTYVVTGGSPAMSLVPVIIGSAADVAQRALVTGNSAGTLVVAEFKLPIIFAETYRKEYDMTELGALATGYDDGTNVGTATLELTHPAYNGTTNVSSALAVKCCYEYDELVARAGTKIYLEKEYSHTVGYSATGDIETATQLYNNGDALARVSLLVASGDFISRVVVKQGSRVLRDLTFTDSVAVLAGRDYNANAFLANRFDIEFDLNDDPNSAPLTSKSNVISIVATMKTVQASANMTVLSTYYGGLD
jgi:hypothetical protein